MQRSGILFVISAPSGAGKTTLCDLARAAHQFVYSVSCTTRQPRRGESTGVDYHFIDAPEFEKRIKAGYFLEHATVHGNSYGTPLAPIKDSLAKGLDVLLDIDVQGAAQIRNHPDPQIRKALVDVFLMTGSVAELERRLRKRATDEELVIQGRLAVARQEIAHWPEYAYVIISGVAEADFAHFDHIVHAERWRASRLTFEGL